MKNDVRKLAFVFAAAALLAGGTVAHVSSAEVLEVGAASYSQQKEFAFDSSPLSDGLSTDGTFTNNSYYRLSIGSKARIDASALLSSGHALSSGISADIAVGTYGTWSGDKTVEMKVSLLSSSGAVLSSTSETSTTMGKDPVYGLLNINVPKPEDVLSFAALEIEVIKFNTSTSGTLRFNGVKLDYSEEEVAPLSSVVLEGEVTKKNYFVGEHLDVSELKVIAIFDDESKKDVTGQAKWSYEPAELRTTDTSATAHASVTINGVEKEASVKVEGLTVEKSNKITYSKLTKAEDLKAGFQVVFANSNGSKLMGFYSDGNNIKAVNSDSRLSGSNVLVEPDIDTDIGIYEVEKGSVNGTFAFKDTRAKQYLYAAGGTGKNNYLKLQDNVDGNASFKISFAESNPVVAAQGDAARNILKFNTESNLFSCYATGQDAISMYVYNPAPELSGDGGAFIDTLLNDLHCDGGVTPVTETAWNDVAEFYTDLPDSDKAMMKNAKADAASEFDLEKAMAKYDYIVAKYGYTDYIGREPTPAQANNVLPMMSSNDKTTILLSVMGVAGVALAGAFFLSRKRKMAR